MCDITGLQEAGDPSAKGRNIVWLSPTSAPGSLISCLSGYRGQKLSWSNNKNFSGICQH